jgi:hypothetical protein
MKLLIKGSVNHLQQDIERINAIEDAKRNDNDKKRLPEAAKKVEEFKAFGKLLGIAAAQRGDQIIVGNLDELAIGSYVIIGLNEWAESRPDPKPIIKVDIHITEDYENFAKRREELRVQCPYVELKPSNIRPGTWSIALLPAIIEAEGVVFVGGGINTAVMGSASFALGKPVLAIPYFEGTAQQEIHKGYQSDYDRISASRPEFKTAINTIRSGPIDSKYTDEVLNAVHMLAGEKSRLSRANWMVLVSLLAAEVALIALWLGLMDFFTTGDFKLFIILFISALLGTGLRNFEYIFMDETRRIQAQRLLVEVIVASILAFGFAHVYLLGGIVFTGNPITLAGNSGSFTRIALSMSLLGIAVAYILSPALDNFRLRAEELISRTNDQ